MPKIFGKFNQLKKTAFIIRKFPGFLKRHYFSFLLGVFVIFIAWGIYIFWQFGIRTVNETPEAPRSSSVLSDEIFQKVTEGLKNRQDFLNQAIKKEYPDIFR